MTATVRNSLLAAAIALLLVLPLMVGNFYVSLLNTIGIATLVTLGLVVLTGCGGLVSFGQAAFVGIGAYSTAWATTVLGLSPWVGLALALATTGAVGLLLGTITLHLGGHYLPLTTIAWGIALVFGFANTEALGRNGGISGIPAPEILGFAFDRMESLYYLIWAIVLAVTWGVANLLRSRQGRAIRSLRGGAVMAGSLGIDVFRVRLTAFVLAALLAGLAGWLYAHMQKYVSPAPFDLRAGIEFLLMAVLGGGSSIAGALIGASAITLLKNALQDLLPLVTRHAGNLEVVAYGVLFILLLQRARGGLVPLLARRFERFRVRPEPVVADGHALADRPLPPAGRPLLRVEGLTKHFGGLAAVSDVSFTVTSGEILALIGPNGAGKSTTFNLVSGVLPASAGSVRFEGRDITYEKQRVIAALGLARTFQHVKLRPTLSLLDNVLLGSHLRTRSGVVAGLFGLDRAEERRARRDAMAQLARVGLADKAEERAGNLSLGQQRVLEIARSLAARPSLLMLDEPAAGLRRPEKKALARLLSGLKADGVTVVIVEHDMEFVMGLVDRIVVLNFGRKLAEGTPEAIRADPSVQTAYLGGAA